MNLALLDLSFYDFYQWLLSIFIFVIGACLCLLISRKNVDIKYITLLYVWHTLFSVYYWYFTLSNGGDAILYYEKSFYLTIDLSPGTRFIETITYFITNILSSNYLNTTLVSNIFGALGLTFLYLTLKKFLVELHRLWLLILFIPSMSFWSAGLGKDSISFMATCLFLYGITEAKNTRFTITLAFLAMFMVRPHIAIIMLISFVVYFILKSKAHLILKFLLLPPIIIGSIVTLQFVQQYIGLGDASLDGLNKYVDQRQGSNIEGGSSLDIASMNYPMQMFTYIFRPLPFEAHSMVALITSIENTILLLLFLYIIIKSKFNFKSFFKDQNLWLLTYIFLISTILAVTTANLGIATRQKWMFMPVLIYLLIYAFYDYKVKKDKAFQ